MSLRYSLQHFPLQHHMATDLLSKGVRYATYVVLGRAGA